MSITLLLDSLSSRLGLLSHKIQMNASINRYSQNIDFEDLFISLINLAYSMNFENANKWEQNAIGVDALDKNNNIVLQITATTSAEKVINSLKKANNSNWSEKANHFKMVYLKDKKPFSGRSVSRINANKGAFIFDANKDYYTADKIYQKLALAKDPIKMQQAIELLDTYLGYLPINKSSGLTSIGLCFDDNDNNFDSVFIIVEQLLKERINVYTYSKKLYDKLKREKNKYFDGLFYIDNDKKLDLVDHYLFILSKQYIENNFGGEILCKYLKLYKETDHPAKIVGFEPNLVIPDTELGNRFRAYNSLQKSNEELKEFSQDLFTNFFNREYKHIPIDVNLLLDQLYVHFGNFTSKDLGSSKECIAVLFTMQDVESFKMIYLVAKPGYSNKGLLEFIRNLRTKQKEKINVLVPKNPIHKTRKALDNLNRLLSVEKVSYIDEFLFEKTSKKFEQEAMQIIEDFVEPVILKNGKTKYAVDILNWINEEDLPSIGIIKAAGGIGKTTIAEKIHDTLIDTNKYKFIVVFINPKQILKEFKSTNFDDHNEYDLYNLFKKAHPQGNTLDEVSFYNNYSQGNILMIFDGIDEIISTVSSFTLEGFLIKLNNLNKRIGRGKILITCRDLYIDEMEHFINTSGKNKLVIYELLPFNQNLAEQYFEKNELNKNKIKKGIELLNKFILEDNKNLLEYVYPPFVIEVVIDILKGEDYDIVLNDNSNSKLLIDGYKSDFILNQIFNRERIKKEQHGISLTIDDQTAIFCFLAIDYNSRIEIDKLRSLLIKLRHFAQLKDAAEGLKDHPLLNKNNGDLIFRYKFLTMEFYTIGIYNLLKPIKPFKLTSYFIDIIGLKANYNSIISKGLLSRLEHEFKYKSYEAINMFRNLMIEINNFEHIEYIRQAAISNLFLIIYDFITNIEKENTNSRELLIRLFSEKKDQVIKNLYLINIPSTSKLHLDFTDLYIEDSKIDGFLNFVFCTFNETTFFVDSCTLKNVKPDSINNIKEITIGEDNFHEIFGDNSLDQVFKLKDKGSIGLEDEIRRYFRFFFKGNVLKELNENFLINSIRREQYLRLIHKICINLNMIQSNKANLIVNKIYRSKVQKFVFQGKTFIEIKNISINISKELL
ncbi:SMEK domain-containing protein [Polaribacter sp. L3A8]|uniref:SMEK domain-containing protein n=1 Tax=Polaribacter sp. L3A8 TaxID=2686361 RepID=UPI00131C5829|nr:SMEK domain-containing protein [Polaribacter sp. L3A8]